MFNIPVSPEVRWSKAKANLVAGLAIAVTGFAVLSYVSGVVSPVNRQQFLLNDKACHFLISFDQLSKHDH